LTRIGRLVGVLDRLSTVSGVLMLFVLVNVISLAISLMQTRANVVTTEARTLDTMATMAQRASDELDERLRHVVALARSVERLPSFWDGADEERDRLLRALGGNGAEYLHTWHQLDGAPWPVAIHVSLAAVLDPIYVQAWNIALTHLTIAAISGLVLWRRTVLRLRRLSVAADRWSSGDLAHRSQLDGGDEVGRVGAAGPGWV
jgi:HAMP domain-containing protein